MKVDAGGLTLNVVRLGTCEGEAPPAVLLHGALIGSMASWYFTCAPALARGRELVLYDLRGHGRSERRLDGYDLDQQVADLIALLDALELPLVDLVGHSFGGCVALHTARLHPERVRRLIVADAPVPPSAAQLLGPLAPDGEIVDADQILSMLPESQRNVLTGGGRRGRRFLESLTFLLRDSSLLDDLDSIDALSNIELLSMPALCVYGADSPCLAAGKVLAQSLGAPLTIVPGGHFVPLTAPAELTAAVEEFLDA
jgi:esterase